MSFLKNAGKRCLSMLLAAIMVFSMMPVMPMTAQAADTAAPSITGSLSEDLKLGVTGTKDTSQGIVTLSGTSITATIDNDYGTFQNEGAFNLQITNNGEAGILTFSYSTSNSGSTNRDAVGSATLINASGVTSGTYTTVLDAGASISMTIKSGTSNKEGGTCGTYPQVKYTVSITNLAINRDVYIATFQPVEDSTQGSYTVDSTAITEETVLAKQPASYTVEVTPATGYSFAGWYSNTTNEYISSVKSGSLVLSESHELVPKFIKTEDGVFGVGDAVFADLNDAADAAANNASGLPKQINLLKSATLPAGNYTIPASVTLLIPFDAAYTCYTDTPEKTNNTYSTPSAYRTLTMDNGAKITVNGAISVSSMQAAGGGAVNFAGSPTGKYGHIKMNAGSSITVGNGANLYAWGFITGDGEVVAENGATIWECMQVSDFRGGNATAGMSGGPVFPFSQYYVQNIETKLTLNYGAKENARARIVMNSTAYTSSVNFIGSDDAMFVIGQGSKVVKDYDPSTDRMILDAYGDISINGVSLGISYITIDSSDFELPISSHLTVNIHSGTATVNQNIAVLPGSQITVDEGATIEIPSGTNLYIYDVDQWSASYIHASSAMVKPVVYSPTRSCNRTTQTLGDAKVTVNGKLLVEGYVYTTESGASIVSDGTGWVQLNPGPGSATTTKQVTQPDNTTTQVNIPITPVKLQNADGSYVETSDAEEFEIYLHDGAKWYKGFDVTIDLNGGEGTVLIWDVKMEEVVATDGTTLPVTNKNIYVGDYSDIYILDQTNVTKEGYSLLNEWNTAKDGTGNSTVDGGYTVTEPVTLYAQWDPNDYTVTFNANDGSTAPATAAQTVEHLVEEALDANTFTRTGYTFTGWNTVAEPTDENPGTAYADSAKVTLTGDITLYAQWDAENYAVEFNGTNVTSNGANNIDYGVEYTADLTLDQCYALTKDDITVTIGGKAYTDFTYENGKLTIPDAAVTGAIEITATATISHTWGETTYKWSADGKSCTAEHVCTVNTEHTETATATISSEVTKDATCEGMGDTTYTATFDVDWATEQTKVVTDVSATGHVWGTATYEWSEDGKSCTAERVCENDDSHVETATATVNGVVTTPAICETKGVTTYTATFTETWATSQTTTREDVAALTHKWGETTYEWSTDGKSCTAEHVCENDDSHVETATATVNGVVTTPATCKAEGTTTYTAAFRVDWAEEQTTTRVDVAVDASNHAGKVVYTNNGDTHSAVYDCCDAPYVTNEAHSYDETTHKCVCEDVKEFTVTWMNGTETFATTSVEFGAVITAPEGAPSKTGYSFASWAGYTDGMTLTEEGMTFTAQWTANTYDATFNANDGAWTDGSTTKTVSIVFGEQIVAPENPTRELYDFVGWTPAVGTMDEEGKNFTAQWTEKNTTIVFHGNGATSGSMENQTLGQVTGGKLTKNTFVRTGYTFIGWTEIGADGAKQFDDEAWVGFSVDTRELWAVWQANTYDATFNANGGAWADGDTTKTVSTAFDSAITAPADPTKTGYTFAGWSPTVGNMTSVDGMTFTAQWTANSYTATFNANGGAWADGDTSKTVSAAFDSAITAPADPTKTGYTFAGWSPTVGNMTSVDGMTFTAQWTANTYDATFNANGGAWADGSTTKTVSTAFDSAITAPADPTKTGYTFAGWEPAVGTMDDVNGKTFTAQWTANSYTATFNANGGAWADGDTTKTVSTAFDSAITAPADPTKIGYTFAGWEPTVGTMDDVNGKTFTAQWTANTYDATFNANGGAWADGSTTKTVSTAFDSAITAPADPTKTGYTFAGWSPTVGNMTSVDGMTFTAQWEAKTYTVTWKIGDYSTTTTAIYGEAIVEPTVEVPENYYSYEWNDVPATMPADENLVIEGYWTVKLELQDENGTVKNTYVGAVGGSIYANYYGTYYKEGHTFWLVDQKTGAKYTLTYQSGMPYWPNVTVTENTVLKAAFEPNEYTLTFKAGYTGENGTEETVTHTLTYGQTVPAVTFTQKGYSFAGWVDEYGTEAQFPATVPGYDATYTATWTANTYDATFNANGGAWAEGESTKTVSTVFGTAITAPTEDPTREGYTFTGWTPEVGSMTEEGMSFTAQWTPNTYDVSITYPAVTTDEPEATYGQTYNANLSAPEGVKIHIHNVLVNGSSVPYTFVDNVLTIEGQYVTGNVHINGVPVVDLTMYANGGKVIAEEDPDYETTETYIRNLVVYGTTNTVTTAMLERYFSREGYTAVGLNTQADGEGTNYAIGESVIFNADTELYVVWQINTYDITVTVDGSKYTVQATYGTTAEELAEKIAEAGISTDKAATVQYAYTFEGWDADGDDDVDGLSEVTGAASYTAVITEAEREYTIWVGSPDGEWAGYTSGKNPYSVISGGLRSYAKDEFASVNPGYTLTGLARTIGGEPVYTVNAEGNVTFTITDELLNTADANGNVYLYGIYEANKYTLTFKSGYDETKFTAMELTYGSDVVSVDFDREGYKFIGWTDESGNAVTVPATVPAQDMTFVAVWEVQKYNAYFLDSDGSELYTWNIPYGDTLQVLSVTKEGYTFDKWLNAEGSEAEIPATMPAKDLYFYASWTVDTYTVTWNVDGSMTTEQVAYGAVINLPAEPTKTGYAFTGWSGYTAGMTMPASDVEFTATWTASICTISLDTNGDGVADKDITASYDSILALDDGSKSADNYNTYTFLGWSTAPNGEVITGQMKVSGDATYYAVFQANPITYTITIDEQGGSEVTDLTGGYEAKVTLPAAPVMEGYTFLGWAETTDPNAETVEAGSEYTITGNDTLYAKWQINQYTITFVTDGGTEIAPITQDYGTAVTAPADPIKEGHAFISWDKEIPETMPAEDMTITAQWQINTYTIGWDIDGDGAADVEDIVNWNVVPVYDAQKHGTITKESTVDTVYTWIGWTVEPVAATADVVYTADFSTAVREYTITWNIEGAETTTSVAYGVVPTWTGDVPTKGEDNYNTYAFASWNTAADGSGTGLAKVEGEATYYAVFTPTARVYTLTIDLDGGAIGGQTAIVISGGYGDAVEAIADPAKTGYTFAGWSDTLPTELTESKTVKANWTVNQYTITLDSGVGEPTVITQEYGTDIEKPADPVKEGYTFTGWTPAIPDTMPAEDVQITAGWSINQYTITFDTNGGSEIAPITQDYGTAVTAPADPTREGYTFKGWDAEVPATMPAESIKLTAAWEANTNTITIYTEPKVEGDGQTPYCVITAVTDADITDQLPADPTKEGHTFGGWVDKDGNTVVLGDKMPTSSMEIYAKWNVTEYTITFELDGGKIGEQAVYTIVQDFGTVVTAPENPIKEGYTFLKWVTKDAEGIETDYTVPETMPAENVTVYAKWLIDQYTISFQDDSGNVLSSELLDYGAVIEVPTVTKTGHTFVQWNETIPGTMPASDVVITSTWTVNQYTITFNTDGGNAVESITADYGTALTAPADPEKEGYTFTGWNMEFPATMPEGGLTLTAQWTINQYLITWKNWDGADLGTSTVDYGQMPAYEGTPVRGATAEYSYSFIGWNTAADGSGEGLSEAAGAATYYAQYEQTANEYTITFNTDGGSEIAPITLGYGSAVQAPEDPTKEGYTFQSWNPELPETMPAENISVTAQWSKVEYTISLDDGTDVTTITAGWGEQISLPADPTKEGYTFGGWANAEGEIITLPETMPVGGLDVKAVWNVNQYTITFNTDGGSEIAPITQDYGTAVTAPEAPTKDGYTFQSWTPELPETMPASDMTVVAQWKYTYTGWKTEEGGITYLIDGEKHYFGEWAEIDGKSYYFDDLSYVLTDICETISPDGSHEGLFVFDLATGAFRSELTGVYTSVSGDTYYVVNGEADLNAGLVRTVTASGVVEYYYFCYDTVCNLDSCPSNGTAVKNGVHWVEKNNGMLVKWDYTFDANGVIIHNVDTTLQGVHEDENGVECYYIDGVKVHYGLFMIGDDYYYARATGELVKNRFYWISITNGLMKEGSYEFDETGKMVIEKEPEEEIKNGIYAEDGSLYYYKDNVRTYAGLIQLDGEYYYVKTNCEVVHGGVFYITKTNGLMKPGNYNFDETGKMIPMPTVDLKNGIYEENGGLYYYKDGKLFYAGLIEIDGYFYYVNSSCKVVTSCTYWISKTNDLMPEKSYTFDEQGRMVNPLVFEDEGEVKNGIVDENGTLYYYENGVLTYAGLIEIDGSYYYVNSSCQVITGRKYWISKTNGLMAEKAYTFDETGKMVMD